MYSNTVKRVVDSGQSCLEASTMRWTYINICLRIFIFEARATPSCAHKKYIQLALLLLIKYYYLSLFFVNDQKLNLIVPYNLDEEINKRGNKVIYH